MNMSRDLILNTKRAAPDVSDAWRAGRFEVHGDFGWTQVTVGLTVTVRPGASIRALCREFAAEERTDARRVRMIVSG